jgi:3-deoxy-D-manno-octulosonate 8-phosphate phosphatase (KDO 8-P phosphatase)
MRRAEVEAVFSALGGQFLTPAAEIARRVAGIRAIVLDWDGVFSKGAKGEGVTSTFSEADSMGLNLLRFALWRARGELPFAALITGEDNPSARRFAAREHLHAVYSGAKDKRVALAHVCEMFAVEAPALVYVFDDVNDLGMAARCGLRAVVRRDASPLLQDYVARHGLCDYLTGADAGEYAVREVSELLLGLLGTFGDVVRARSEWAPEYVRYFEARQAVEPRWETTIGAAPTTTVDTAPTTNPDTGPTTNADTAPTTTRGSTT